MNLFPTHPDPMIAAQHLDDKRVSKIALEAAQIASTVIWLRGGPRLYKPTHKAHPVTVWAEREPGALKWAIDYGIALCDTYLLFGKNAEHGSLQTLRLARKCLQPQDKQPVVNFHNSARNLGRGLDFTHILDVHRAYQEYLAARWSTDVRPPKWTGRSRPVWS